MTKKTTRELSVAKSNIYQKSLIGDLQVDINKKITGIGVSKIGNEEDAKNLAKWNAIERSGADAIVDPVYSITLSGKNVTANVTGYYGKFKSIELATTDDLMTYIQVNINSGTGILGVSFSQYQDYYNYYFDKYELDESQRLSENALYNDYQSKVQDAQVRAANESKSTKNNGGKGKKLAAILIVYSLLAAALVPLLSGY